MRIDRFLSDMGISSRKESAQAARRGGVLVNGIPVKDASKHIDPDKDVVTYLGRKIEYRKHVWVMLNKPAGYVSATEDSKLPVVTELLSDELQRMELFPVGRLDRDTVGLMLLTNDGNLAHTLLSPKHHVAKEYYFKSAEPLAADAESRFKERITLADGYECKEAELVADPDRMGGVITLTEGKYHQIKRMVAATDNAVIFLERISFAGIPLDRTLESGEWRMLTEEEIALLESSAK